MTGSLARSRTEEEAVGPVGRAGAVLAAVCACTALVVGFVASINLAVPDLAAGSLHPSSSQLLWIVDAYVVFFACLVIPAGALGDRCGRKGVLLAGLIVFAAGAAVSATAPDVAVMLVGRAVSGIGAAAVLPNGLAVLVHATQPSHRPRAIAVWAAMTGVGGVIGNVGGGAVLESGSWRWLFLAVVPLALACAAWIAVQAPASARHDRRLAPAPTTLLTLATLSLLIGIVQGPAQGWGNAVVVGGLGASLVLFAGWVVAELRSAEPLLDPRLFTIPALRASCLGMLVVFFGMFGFFFLNASLLQYGRGFTALQAGLGILPLSVPLLIAARAVPGLVAKVGDRAVLAGAFAVVTVGLFGTASAVDQPYAVYAVWLVVMGIGITLALPTLTIIISAALPAAQAGVAGGLQSTTREFGSALGVAVIGTILAARFTHRPGGGSGTVAKALLAHDANRAAVIGAYDASARTTLQIAAVIVLVAGALVIAEMSSAARRRTRRVGIDAPTVSRHH